MCLTRGGMGGEYMRGLGLPILWEQGSVERVSVFEFRWCRWYMWVGGLYLGLEGWGGVMSV